MLTADGTQFDARVNHFFLSIPVSNFFFFFFFNKQGLGVFFWPIWSSFTTKNEGLGGKLC